MIIDWIMPGMDGPELIRWIRAWRNEQYSYAILLTSRSQKQDLLEGMEAGADDYLSKPFDPTELKLRLRAGRRILDLQERLIATREELRQQASQDPMLHIPNRRSVLECLTARSIDCRRERQPLGILMIDLDHFKSINDTYGHAAGDAVLITAAKKMSEQLRSTDLIGRFGGEEFLVVLPETNTANLMRIAERIRKALASTAVTINNNTIHFTCSIGAAVRQIEMATDDKSLIQLADAALYNAKHAGRDQISAAWNMH